MKYKDLPADIKAIAYQRAKEQGYIPKENSNLSDYPPKAGFWWDKTVEGEDIWVNVDEGNFAPFYEFHNAEYSENYLPNQYDEVEFSNYEDSWKFGKFLSYNKFGKKYKFVAVDLEGEIWHWKRCRPIQSVKMTVAELVQFASETKGKKVEVIQ